MNVTRDIAYKGALKSHDTCSEQKNVTFGSCETTENLLPLWQFC